MPARKFKFIYSLVFAAMAAMVFGVTYLSGFPDVLYSVLAGLAVAYLVTGMWPNILLQTHRELDIRIACAREARIALEERLSAIRRQDASERAGQKA